MKKEYLLKITRNTRLWRKGQKVWSVWGTGALAHYVVGKYRGKGRWIRGWANYADKDGKGFFCKPNARYIGEVEVSDEFSKYIESLGGRNVRSSMSSSE